MTLAPDDGDNADWISRIHRLRAKYPDRVPILISKSTACTNRRIPDMKLRMLVPREMSVAQFLHTLRSKIKLTATDALYLFVQNVIPPGSMHFGLLDSTYRDPSTDVLNVVYAGEATFGLATAK